VLSAAAATALIFCCGPFLLFCHAVTFAFYKRPLLLPAEAEAPFLLLIDLV